MTMSTSLARPVTRALVRRVGGRFLDATVQHQPAQAIDLRCAVQQHAAYVEALRDSGLRVVELGESDAHPDGCFVEDQAVVLGERALVTRSGCPARRGEAPSVEAALAAHVEVVRMKGPATLDGGDVLRLGRHLFVGISGRTNRAGVDVLASFASTFEVVPVPVGGLHLKCLASPVGPDRVLVATGLLDPGIFSGIADVLVVDDDDAYAANCLALSDRVLVAAGYPRVVDTLTDAGLTVQVVETSEIAKADGSLTCMSVLF